MKPYTNKIDRVDDRKCLYSEIRHSYKGAKKAKRREGKIVIKNESSEKYTKC